MTLQLLHATVTSLAGGDGKTSTNAARAATSKDSNAVASSLLPLLCQLSNLQFWSEGALERLLTSTSVLGEVESDRKRAAKEFELYGWPFVQEHPNLFPGLGTKEKTKDLYNRCQSMCAHMGVETKDGETVLSPVVGAVAKHCGDGNCSLQTAKQNITLLATSEIAIGDPVTLGAGLHSNAGMLRRYGTTAAPGASRQVFAEDTTSVTLHDIFFARDQARAADTASFRARKEKFLFDRGFLCLPDDSVFKVPRWVIATLNPPPHPPTHTHTFTHAHLFLPLSLCASPFVHHPLS